MKKSVILLGKGLLAQRVGDWFLHSPAYALRFVVPNVPESTWQPSLRTWAQAHSIPYAPGGHFGEVPDVAADAAQDGGWTIDLAVSVGYNKIVEDGFIQRCGRIINIHNAPLPRYRGMNPINWALKNGERQHGVTIHNITPAIDAGPIVSQVCFPIDPDSDEVIDVYERCLDYGWRLFIETMPSLWDIDPREQDHAAATYHWARQADALGDRRSFTRRESIQCSAVK